MRFPSVFNGFLIAVLLGSVLPFVAAGAAATSSFRIAVPGTIAGRVAFWYLAGISVAGTLLYVLGALGVPLTRGTIAALFVAAVIVAAVHRARLHNGSSAHHHWAATAILVVPLAALLLMTAVLPVRDYDGRVTWLPKALAIAQSGTLDGPFFQGNSGLNLHNEYPLLMPIDAAAVLIATGRTDVESVRWLYALLAIAALLAARDLIAVSQPRSAAWVIAAGAWLPIFLSIEGGALAAYNDVAVLALTGLAVLSLHNRDVRAAALFLPALVLLKNEGVVIALVVIASMAVVRRLRSVRDWLTVALPASGAVVLLLAWRRSVPAAYDEQYDVLVRTLPEALRRLPGAAGALLTHAADPATWGWFWLLTVAASVVALAGRQRMSAVGPLLVLFAMFTVYAATFAVTSWNIAELARVAASRLLLHLVLPACMVLAVAGETLSGRPAG